jgi:acyl-coenzyme A synthetase/AMP-(fatty) acid ligase/thioesterase domain-containing protein/acyl carrier protein
MTVTYDETAPYILGEIDGDADISECYRAIVAKQPHVDALRTTHRVYSYADIDRWSDALAARLIELNSATDKPVAIVTFDSTLLAPAIFGALKAGHFFLTIDASDPEERMQTILKAADVKLCIVDRIEGAPPAIKDLLLIEVGPLAAEAVTPVPRRPPNKLVHLVFTSGTTGTPKGIVTKLDGFVRKTIAGDYRKGLAPGDRVSFTALPGFTRAAGGVLSNLLMGTTLCHFNARGESLTALAKWIASEKVSFLSLTPSLFRRLVAAVPAADLDFSQVRMFRMGADRVTIADVEAFRRYFPKGCVWRHGFAATELGGGIMNGIITHDTVIDGPLVPIGKPRADVEVRLIDEDGNDVAIGEVGEIVVTSAEVVDGYWNDPELTAKKFRTDAARPNMRTYYTGDLAKRDAAGHYYFMGRKDARLKIHSRRIDPVEVETALITKCQVRDAAVVGKNDPDGTMRLVAYVVMNPGEKCEPRAIRAELRRHLPIWMVPVRIYEIEEMPVIGAGKVDRKVLVARIDDEPQHDSGAKDELEATLAAIWSRVTGVPVHVDDDFFDDLGGESVVAAHLVAEVEKATGRSMHLSLLLEFKTVTDMADFIRTGDVADRLAVAVQPSGTKPPLFCMSGRGGSVMHFRPLASALGDDQPLWGISHHGFQDRVPKTFPAVAACFADAIRKVQPKGPYYLAGYSMGGQLAYETARQMRLAGEEIAFLGLIDAGTNDAQRSPLKKRLMTRIALLRERPGPRALQYAREAVGRSRTAIIGRVSGYFAATDMPRWLVRKNKEIASSRKSFVLKPYEGHATLFVARSGLGAARSARDLGWSAVGVSNLEIIEVRGDHDSVLKADVDSIAAVMKDALERARLSAIGNNSRSMPGAAV